MSLNGNGSPKDAEVEGQLIVDGRPVTLKRVFQEKWVKKRGSAEAEFSGHETTLFYNEVPVSLREYQDKVSALCSEDVFKMVTNPWYFSSLHWEAQRKILFEIAGDAISDQELASRKPEFEALLKELTGKTLEEYRKQIAAHKRRLKSELELIPARIDEVNRSIPPELDWKGLAEQLKETEAELAGLEASITDQSKAYEKEYQQRTALLARIHEVRNKLNTLVADYREEALKGYRDTLAANNRIRTEIENIRKDILYQDTRLIELNKAIRANEQVRDVLRNNWHTVHEERFSFDQDVCPACNRPFENAEQMKQEMLEAFNRDKAFRLDKISEEGQRLKDRHEELSMAASNLRKDMEKLKLKAQQLTTEIVPVTEPKIIETEIPAYPEARSALSELEAEYQKPLDQPDLEKLKEQKALLQAQIMEVREKLSLKDQINKADLRVSELEKEQQTLAQELANLERQEFIIQDFEKARADAIEQKINGMFEIVRWKLFEKQVNGQEIPACKATHNRVPYSDLNSAAKANVGLDIINTLSKHFGITAPVFFDNREGINRLISTPSQLINLSVTKDPELVIEIQN
jgi:chromosome segregation ATPase